MRFSVPRVGVIPIGIALAAVALVTPLATAQTATSGPNTTTALADYSPDQISNAAVIVAVGERLHVPEKAEIVAITAALEESGLHNLNYGDRDSLGLFQQRPSQGWGSPSQILNPAYAATQFYRHLLAVPGWQQMSVNDAAQTVQRSRFPDAYAPYEHAARVLAAAVRDSAYTDDSDGDEDS
jgi:hypothetical protein